MKKFLCILLASLALTLCACRKAENTVRSYDEPGRIPTHITRLYPEKDDDEKYAVLLRRYDETLSAVAVSDGVGGELNTVYTLPEGVITYELTAGGGLIAFFELTTYGDGGINYALKVIDTNDNNKVHSPYKKTVADENDIQTRFIAVYGGCVYYLTKSNLLGRCRVMKYSTADNELTEYVSYDFTENQKTGGSSCTCISERGGYLTCAAVDGKRTTLKTYDLKNGCLVREKALPYNVELVYMAEHDYDAGTYAIYYLSAQGDERVAAFSYTDGDVRDLMKFDENTYVNREEVRIYADSVYFEIQDSSKETEYGQFTGVIIDAGSKEIKKYEGCVSMFVQNGAVFGLCFDKNEGIKKMNLKKLADKGAEK